MRIRWRSLWLEWLGCMLLPALLGACGGDHQVATPDAPSIDWFDGSIESALAEARDTDRPVFLYWGAVWCPYCQQLKSSVFTRPDFIEKSGRFVAVYLDGDDPGAQKWGERLRVSGYPTVLILRPDGTELMRIAGGMDVERYAGILDLALANTRSVREILQSVAASAEPLSMEDCRRLAWHGFVLDDELELDEVPTATLLSKAADSCPAVAETERARLRILAAAVSIAAAPTDAATVARVTDVVDLLADPKLAVSTADALFMLDERFFATARDTGESDAGELRDRWFRVMDAAMEDARYSASDQLFALTSRLQAAKAFGVLTPDVERMARSRVDAALAVAGDPVVRASVVNASLYVLDTLGDDDAVYALAEREIAASATPYYYMPTLASIDEKRGRTEAAVTWLERAYRESQGPATRFQWGTSYVAGLIRMQPAEEARIRDAVLSVLGELEGPDRLYQRTHVRIDRLENALRQWNADGTHAATLAAARSRMRGICARVPADEPDARAACEGFLEPA